MDKTTSVVQGLVEALMELSPGHPATRAGIDWLTAALEQRKGLPPGMSIKACRNCGEDFFFANRVPSKKPPFHGKIAWVPICTIPIQSVSIILDAVSLDWDNRVDPKHPTIRTETLPGEQWIPHSVLCGMDERPSGELGMIWDQTVGTLVEDRADAIVDLLQVLEDEDD